MLYVSFQKAIFLRHSARALRAWLLLIILNFAIAQAVPPPADGFKHQSGLLYPSTVPLYISRCPADIWVLSLPKLSEDTSLHLYAYATSHVPMELMLFSHDPGKDINNDGIVDAKDTRVLVRGGAQLEHLFLAALTPVQYYLVVISNDCINGDYVLSWQPSHFHFTTERRESSVPINIPLAPKVFTASIIIPLAALAEEFDFSIEDMPETSVQQFAHGIEISDIHSFFQLWQEISAETLPIHPDAITPEHIASLLARVFPPQKEED